MRKSQMKIQVLKQEIDVQLEQEKDDDINYE